VARRIDDVDLRAGQDQGDVFGQDRDAALALEVVGVEDEAMLPAREPVQLLFAEQPRLAHHHVHERRFAVVDVGNNRNIAKVGSLHEIFN
jgi:hypothetical protein